MITKLFRSKSGKFINFPTALTVGNIFFIIVILLVLVFILSFLSKQLFGTKVIAVGVPFKVLIVGTGLVLSFYIVTRRQGGLDRSDVFAIALLSVSLLALFIYLPKLLPEIFTSSTISESILATNPESPFVIISNISTEIHTAIQSIVPIP